ncbi:argininosuccinate synthase, partial [Desulfosoma sp.]
LEAKALASGASQLIVRDLREEFARDYLFRLLRAGAIYERKYLLGTSIARPLIAKHQVEVAHQVGADAVAHGATGKGNDQVRFELTYTALAPHLKVIAPWREWNLKSRQALLEFARKHGIPVPVTPEKPYSCDANLLHISYEGGILEDPWREPDPSMFTLTVDPREAPDEPEIVELDFVRGDPVAINGEPMTPATLLDTLNRIGGRHGVGRADVVESRFVGMKSRGVYETPGGTILRIAHLAMESITMDREVMFLRDSLIPQYAKLIYNGFWYAPERLALQSLIDTSQENVSGTVRVKLYKGSCTVIGRKSDRSLYDPQLATFEEDDVYRQSDATGFIRLQGLRLRVQNLLRSRAQG